MELFRREASAFPRDEQWFWFGPGTPGAKAAAVVVAAGPVTLLGAGFGPFMLVLTTVGRNARWN